MDPKFRDPHISGSHLACEDGETKPDTLLASQSRAVASKHISLCGHVYWLGSVTIWQQQNALNYYLY